MPSPPARGSHRILQGTQNQGTDRSSSGTVSTGGSNVGGGSNNTSVNIGNGGRVEDEVRPDVELKVRDFKRF